VLGKQQGALLVAWWAETPSLATVCQGKSRTVQDRTTWTGP